MNERGSIWIVIGVILAIAVFAYGIWYSVSKNAIEQPIIAQADQAVMDRVGSTTFHSEFHLASVQSLYNGNEYNVQYQFTPRTDPGENLPITILVIPGGTLTPVDIGLPDCAHVPTVCDVTINKDKAIQIAVAANTPGNWSASFIHSSLGFYWQLTLSINPPCQNDIHVDATSGKVVYIATECPPKNPPNLP